MKGLLHSKLFRKNLCKWIFMYIVAIGLFTSVVTYSKYISSVQSEGDKAKVAKFDASITYDRVCTTLAETEICNIGNYRPTSDISYYFTVDTTNIEVAATFVTLITVDSKFKNVRIYDVTDIETEMTFTKNENKFTLVEDIDTGNTYIRKYKVTMNFDNENNDINYSSEHKITGSLTVGYSAEQKD